MSSTLAVSRMGKKKKQTTSVRIDEDLSVKASVVASSRNMSVPEYLSLVLRPIVERDHREYIKGESLKIEDDDLYDDE